MEWDDITEKYESPEWSTQVERIYRVKIVDGEYVGTCDDFPHLSYLANNRELALDGIKELVASLML